jgi:hypothetical protein
MSSARAIGMECRPIPGTGRVTAAIARSSWSPSSAAEIARSHRSEIARHAGNASRASSRSCRSASRTAKRRSFSRRLASTSVRSHSRRTAARTHPAGLMIRLVTPNSSTASRASTTRCSSCWSASCIASSTPIPIPTRRGTTSSGVVARGMRRTTRGVSSTAGACPFDVVVAMAPPVRRSGRVPAVAPCSQTPANREAVRDRGDVTPTLMSSSDQERASASRIRCSHRHRR